jgi:putative folate metabolism gamma-glutamate ligase
MIVKPIKTAKILPSEQTIYDLLDKYLPKLEEQSVVAVTSKIISLCEGRIVPFDSISKQELIKQESDYYLPPSSNKYDYNFSINQSTLASMGGIDESNGDGYYILWPENSQNTANEVRKYLKEKFNLKEIGVVITDSTCMPMRWGTVGNALGYSGFKALNNYIGKPDLFGRPFKVSQAGVAIGLAGSAVLAMGEGTEQTPIAIITDAAFVEFQDRNPTKEELELFYIKDKDDDLFVPFLNSVKWHEGRQSKPK